MNDTLKTIDALLKPKDLNCEPPYPLDGMVLFSIRSPDWTGHLAHAECSTELPHKITECGLWRGDTEKQVNKDEAIELLPCPFCGGEAELEFQIGDIGDTWAVICVGNKMCPCYSHRVYCLATQMEAIDNWNRRAASVPRWTRVEDGLPEKAGRYLITRLRKADGRHLTREAFFDYEFTRTFAPFDPIKDVIAWMPLPQPFTEEQDEQR